jgi:hypothetical protein
MKNKVIAVLSCCIFFVLAPLSQAWADRSVNGEDTAFPEIIGGDVIEVFPLALSNFAGFDSLLIVSNFSQAFGNFQVCGLPVGGTSFVCRGDSYAPLESKFIELPTIGISNNFGQVQVRSIGGTFGGAGMLVFSLTGAGMTYVPPTEFVAN